MLLLCYTPRTKDSPGFCTPDVWLWCPTVARLRIAVLNSLLPNLLLVLDSLYRNTGVQALATLMQQLNICFECATCVCVEDKIIKMPRFAFSNAKLLGRQHPLIQHASLGLRLLLGLGRPCFRKLLLGAGHREERQSGSTGNHVLVSQGAPSISEVLPPSSRQLSDSFVAVFWTKQRGLV